MEFICETKNYNVVDFHDLYQAKLPQLVKVAQGYCGEIASDVFDKDQVIRVQAVARQKRVIAKFQLATHENRLFSIPSSYFDKVCLVNKYGKASRDEKFMFEILRGFPLPQTVRFPKNRKITVGNNSVNTNNVPDIELVEIFEEVSLLGNFINDGEMCTDLIHVPLYLSHLRLALITGIKGYSPSQWKHYIEELDNAALCIEYDLMFGNPEIAEYDPNAVHSADDTYTYVQPSLYSNIAVIMQRPVVHSLPADEKTQAALTGAEQDTTHGDVYEEIQQCSNEAKKTKAPVVPPKPKQASKQMAQSKAPALPKRNANVHAKPPENVSHNYTNDVPRTQVKPTQHDKPDTTPIPQNIPAESAKQNEKQEVVSTNVPNVSNSDDISKLTIDEVIVYLKKLGLGQYEDTFREQMIDGVLLLELDRDMLKDDFGMKGIEALRLTRFAKDGHVPT